jgi:hypothetical protein
MPIGFLRKNVIAYLNAFIVSLHYKKAFDKAQKKALEIGQMVNLYHLF